MRELAKQAEEKLLREIRDHGNNYTYTYVPTDRMFHPEPEERDWFIIRSRYSGKKMSLSPEIIVDIHPSISIYDLIVSKIG